MRTFTLIILIQTILQAIVNGVSALTERPPICENNSCDEYCPYGNMIDGNNCRTCICNKPCTDLNCPPGEECRAEVLPCSSTGEPCGYMEKCGPPCPLRKCVPKYCPYGFEFDEEGCQMCECMQDHCKNLNCAPGEICTVEYITRFNPAGGVRPKCTKKCNDLPCHYTSKCAYGYERDCDNCPTCACRNPCNGVLCSKGYHCVVQTINCITDPCPQPWASCEPYCPENSSSLIGLSDYAVQCTTGAWNCPKGYDCVNVPYLNQSYCCSTPSQ